MLAMAVPEKDQKRILEPEPLELELLVVVSWPTWVLGIKFGFSGRTDYT